LGEQYGQLTGEHRIRLIRWVLQELAETTDGITRSAAAVGWSAGEWTDLEAAWRELRRTIEPWLADAEQRVREEGLAAT
jgi:hypothetical protein